MASPSDFFPSPRGEFSRPRHARRQKRGAALIIALASIVLLTVVVLAFLSHVTIESQVSASNADQVQVDTFARGALASIVGDLKQEIAAGSTITTVTTGGVTSTIYAPTDYTAGTAATASPAYVPLGSGTGGLLNLVKESTYNTSFFPATGYTGSGTYPPSNRAAPVSTGTAGASLNGRYVSPARWNKPLLLPASSTTDLTPSGNFTVPDWILVARNGTNPLAWNSNMAASPGNATTATTVVGRYAYTIYDEGGLLDMNVAGYPGATPPTLSGYKNALALADLTQIGLAQAQIDALVGWRNSASGGGPSGSINGAGSSYNWSAGQAAAYYNAVTNNVTGFLGTNPFPTPAGPAQTDQAFISRQQLIQFILQGLGGGTPLQSALQYMGTFSRDLNQPSTVTLPEMTAAKRGNEHTVSPAERATLAAGDATHRPTVVPPSNIDTSVIPSVTQEIYYQGGNDAYGGNDGSLITSTSDTRINPSFLSVRVATAFTRIDGSAAQPGEPLVKKRFPLSRLALFSGLYNTSASASVANSISANFGLSRASTSAPWFYDHGIKDSSASPQVIIGTLAKVAAAGREPDFFELLKAAITSGSIGKGADGVCYVRSQPASTSVMEGAGLYQQNLDVATDFQILQIGANIIEQYKADAYPIRIDIQPAGPGHVKWEFRGVENLPYVQSMRFADFQTGQIPDSSEPQLNPTSPYFYPQDKFNPAIPPGGQSQGLGTLLMQPVLWNPHDPNSNPAGAPSPTNFRVVVDTTTPTYLMDFNNGTASAYQPCQLLVFDFALGNQSYTSFSMPLGSALTAGSSPNLTFSLPNLASTLFREPTIMSIPGVPSGSNLTGQPGSGGIPGSQITDYTPGGSNLIYGNGHQFVGFPLGVFPLRFATPLNAPPAYFDPKYSCMVNQTWIVSPLYFTARVQYSDPVNSGQWDTYDEKVFSIDLGRYYDGFWWIGSQWSSNTTYIVVGTGASGSAAATFQGKQLAGTVGQLVGYDPRSSRFGNTAANIADTYNVPPGPNNVCGPPPYGLNSWYANGFNQVASAPFPYNSFLNQSLNTVPSLRAGSATDPGSESLGDTPGDMWTPPSGQWIGQATIGWTTPARNTDSGFGVPFFPGKLEQNDPRQSDPSQKQYDSKNYSYYSDPDGIFRPAMGSNAAGGGFNPNLGLPMQIAAAQNAGSRPIILHRPFRSVAELGYVFSGTPWKNLDFWNPESGNAALLDVFCLNETDNQTGLVAGKVNLNTRQAPVLAALLNGAYKDETAMQSASPPLIGSSMGTEASLVAQALVTRTTNIPPTSGKGPLKNLSELVGRYVPGLKDTFYNPYDGFSADLSPSIYLLGTSEGNIQRFREASIRALSNAGTTRVWNLMIDLVAQTGHYPGTATGLNNFNVEGEKRYWLHVAIDRYTGQVIDSQIEVVKE